jgi:transposase
MPGKELTNTQKAYITQITGDNTAWQRVQLNGYVLTVELSQQVINGATKYIAEYTLVYSKGDSIRKVEGRHILI